MNTAIENKAWFFLFSVPIGPSAFHSIGPTAFRQPSCIQYMPTVSDSIQLTQGRISAIREEHDINLRITMLHGLNNLLPVEKRMKFPSLITNAYIRIALDVIQERILPKAHGLFS